MISRLVVRVYVCANLLSVLLACFLLACGRSAWCDSVPFRAMF